MVPILANQVAGIFTSCSCAHAQNSLEPRPQRQVVPKDFSSLDQLYSKIEKDSNDNFIKIEIGDANARTAKMLDYIPLDFDIGPFVDLPDNYVHDIPCKPRNSEDPKAIIFADLEIHG